MDTRVLDKFTFSFKINKQVPGLEPGIKGLQPFALAAWPHLPKDNNTDPKGFEPLTPSLEGLHTCFLENKFSALSKLSYGSVILLEMNISFISLAPFSKIFQLFLVKPF